jgi:hypothetical protein
MVAAFRRAQRVRARGFRLAEVVTMNPPLLRSPRLSILAVILAGTAFVACADAGPGSSTGSSHNVRTGSGTPSTGNGSGDSSNSGSSNGGTPKTGGTPSPGDNGGKPGDNGTPGNNGDNGTPPSNNGGDNNTPTPPPASAPAFDVLVDNASPTVNLAEEAVIQVTVAPQSYSGAVALSVTGLPTDVTGTFDKATLNVSGTTGASAKLTLKTISSSAPGATPIKIVATAGATTKEATATLNVKSIITIKIPVNVDANEGPNVFGTINIKAPANLGNGEVVTVNFLNLDSTPHEIHAGNPAQGFPHGSGTFGQNKMDKPRNVTATGSFKFYLHDEGSAKTPGTIVIQ